MPHTEGISSHRLSEWIDPPRKNVIVPRAKWMELNRALSEPDTILAEKGQYLEADSLERLLVDLDCDQGPSRKAIAISMVGGKD